MGSADRATAGRGPTPWISTGGLCGAVVPWEQGPRDREGGDAEHAPADAEVHRERDPQTRGGGSEEPAGDRADAPEAVEGVADRPAVPSLHPEPVGVLGHVDDGIQRAGDEHRGGQQRPVRRGGRPSDGDREEEQAAGTRPAELNRRMERGRGQPPGAL